MPDRKLPIALAIIRYSVFAFFAVWVVEKFVKPESTVAIWKIFYFTENLPLEASYGIGVVQAVILIGFVLGLARTWTYGLLTLMHALSTLSTYEPLLDPYTRVNHLFWAAVPTLGAMIALFLLREADTIGTLRRR
ncbi:MAG: DoxX protein [Alphaproteobacteria bacterium]|nr:DoxX protein [Alphaproteobacteria bacterium]